MTRDVTIDAADRFGGWVVRDGTPADAPAILDLIRAHQTEGHLLPRDLDDVTRHAARFVVCEQNGAIDACAELAPLSARVAEVRSLVVSPRSRRHGVAGRVVHELQRRALDAKFESLCALAHDPRLFIHHNFSIVPHAWLPEKIVKDCLGCPLFRRCGQYAMVLPLQPAVHAGGPAVVTHRRVAVA
jgi:amino-acid N-acetyltransferase